MNVLFAFLLVAALRPETGRFTIYQDGKKIGTEEFTITPRRGGYSVEGRTVFMDPNNPVDLKSRMELNENLNLTSYDFQSTASSIHLKIDSPTSELEYTVQGAKKSDDVRFPDGGAIMDTNFFHHYAILLYRFAAVPAKSTLPVFVPQQLELGSITMKNTGNNTFEIDTGNFKVVATTDKDGRLIRLNVPDAKVVVER